MNILVVSSYPPLACGIGKYAEQQVNFMRRQGHHVDVLALEGGEGEYRVNLLGGLRPLRLLKYAVFYDEIHVHFTPHFFYQPLRRIDRLLTSLALVGAGALGRKIIFVVHETAFHVGDPRTGLRRLIDRLYWRLARRVVFHSQSERDSFLQFYGFNDRRPPTEIWSQSRFIEPRYPHDKQRARRELGLPVDQLLLLCIGFIQPHKGFDQAVRAMQQVQGDRLILRVVGSVRLAWDEAHRYARELHRLCAQDPRCEFIEDYLSDEAFDQWVVAADYIVLPYKEIWTSAVAARAQLYGRPMIAAQTGALGEQLTAGSRSFATESELSDIFAAIAAES